MLYNKTKTILILVLVLLTQLGFSGNVSRNVNLFMGTAGDHGQVDPAACVPYGMVRIAPDCNPRNHSGYDYEVKAIKGFSINRISGIGCDGAGGNICIRPASKDEKIEMIKKTENAFPGYYTVKLNNGVRTEFSATNHVGFEQYHFPKGVTKNMYIDFYSSFGGMVDAHYEVISLHEVKGYVYAKNTCGHGAYKLFFYINTNTDFIVTDRAEKSLSIQFPGKNSETVELHLALSPIDEKSAQDEYMNVAGLSFRQVKSHAKSEWENLLSKVKVSGSKEGKALFYTSLYRTFLTPANVTSVNGQYLGTDGKIYDKQDFSYYSSWSMWDTYRTKFPFMTLLDADKMHDIALSLCKLYVNGKKDWATMFESTPTVRTEHASTVILDAYKKGVTGINLAEAYNGIKSEVDNWPMNRPDQILEGCIDMWTLSEIAGIIGKKADSIRYEKKARKTFLNTWNKEFKNTDESFSKMRNNGLYQGTRWQYRWALPQYLDLMSASVGGADNLANELDYFFHNNFNNQGNEPGIHAPFIFNRLHQPEKTQQYVTHILHDENVNVYGGNAEYPQPVIRKIFMNTPEGYLPEMDEDDGTMSAWYVFSTIGIFPLVVGEPWYELTSPSFNNVVLRLDNGNKLIIRTKNRKSIYDPIKEINFNDKVITDYRINHNELIKGGVLNFLY